MVIHLSNQIYCNTLLLLPLVHASDQWCSSVVFVVVVCLPVGIKKILVLQIQAILNTFKLLWEINFALPVFFLSDALHLNRDNEQ